MTDETPISSIVRPRAHPEPECPPPPPEKQQQFRVPIDSDTNPVDLPDTPPSVINFINQLVVFANKYMQSPEHERRRVFPDLRYTPGARPDASQTPLSRRMHDRARRLEEMRHEREQREEERRVKQQAAEEKRRATVEEITKQYLESDSLYGKEWGGKSRKRALEMGDYIKNNVVCLPPDELKARMQLQASELLATISRLLCRPETIKTNAFLSMVIDESPDTSAVRKTDKLREKLIDFQTVLERLARPDEETPYVSPTLVFNGIGEIDVATLQLMKSLKYYMRN